MMLVQKRFVQEPINGLCSNSSITQFRSSRPLMPSVSLKVIKLLPFPYHTKKKKKARLCTEGTSLESSLGGDGDGADGTGGSWEGLEPGTVVELSVLLLDLSILVDLHVVDAVDWVWGGSGGGDLPSPGDVSASVPDVQGLGLDLRLENTLTVVEGSLAGEGNGAKL